MFTCLHTRSCCFVLFFGPSRSCMSRKKASSLKSISDSSTNKSSLHSRILHRMENKRGNQPFFSKRDADNDLTQMNRSFTYFLPSNLASESCRMDSSCLWKNRTNSCESSLCLVSERTSRLMYCSRSCEQWSFMCSFSTGMTSVITPLICLSNSCVSMRGYWKQESVQTLDSTFGSPPERIASEESPLYFLPFSMTMKKKHDCAKDACAHQEEIHRKLPEESFEQTDKSARTAASPEMHYAIVEGS